MRLTPITGRSKVAKTEMMQAKNTGGYPGRIDEYSALRKSVELDKNLLVVLKKSGRTHLPERVVSEDELGDVCRTGAKTFAGEQDLDGIKGKFFAEHKLRFCVRGRDR